LAKVEHLTSALVAASQLPDSLHFRLAAANDAVIEGATIRAQKQ
jgi:hypothetical protein